MKSSTKTRPMHRPLALAVAAAAITLAPRIALPDSGSIADLTAEQFNDAFKVTPQEAARLEGNTAFLTGTLPSVCAGYFSFSSSTNNPGSLRPVITDTDSDGKGKKTAWIRIQAAPGAVECVKTRMPTQCAFGGDSPTCIALSEVTRLDLKKLNQNVKVALISIDPNVDPAASPLALSDLGIDYLTPVAAAHAAAAQAEHDKQASIAAAEEFLRDTAGQPECSVERADAIASLVTLGVDTAEIEAELKHADLQAELDSLLSAADEAVETRDIEKAAKKLYTWAKKREHKEFATQVAEKLRDLALEIRDREDAQIRDLVTAKSILADARKLPIPREDEELKLELRSLYKDTTTMAANSAAKIGSLREPRTTPLIAEASQIAAEDTIAACQTGDPMSTACMEVQASYNATMQLPQTSYLANKSYCDSMMQTTQKTGITSGPMADLVNRCVMGPATWDLYGGYGFPGMMMNPGMGMMMPPQGVPAYMPVGGGTTMAPPYILY